MQQELTIGRGAGLAGLGGGDRDQPAFFVGRRRLNRRHDPLEELFGGERPGRFAFFARQFAAGMAGVGDDVGERRRPLGGLQVGRELFETDVARRALGPVAQRVEVDDGVTRAFLVGAGSGPTLDVGLPAQLLLGQLAGQRRGLGRVGAAVAFDLARGGDRARHDVGEQRALGRGFHGRPLAAEQRDLVGENAFRHRVIVAQQLAFRDQRLCQVGSGGARPERFLEAVFAEHDQETRA